MVVTETKEETYLKRANIATLTADPPAVPETAKVSETETLDDDAAAKAAAVLSARLPAVNVLVAVPPADAGHVDGDQLAGVLRILRRLVLDLRALRQALEPVVQFLMLE